MPGPVLEDQETYQFVMNLAASTDGDLLLGTIDEADDSREQWHSMPSRNVFTERHQMKFSIELHLFATIGNK